MKKAIKSLWVLFTVLTINICIAVGYYAINLPDSFYIRKGDSLSLATRLSITASTDDDAVQSFAEKTTSSTSTANLKLFGIIPVKNVEVMTVDTPVLIPGGQPFGIKLLMDGVMVIGMGDVKSGTCPAEECGIETGDVIISMDGKKVSSNSEIQSAVSSSDGEPIEVVYTRDEKKYVSLLKPTYSEKDGSFKAGMWVRDSTAGIGTITFYEASTGRFGGLGHPICDSDTGEMIPISSGEVVNVKINDVQRGSEGSPGELRGCFTSKRSVGTIYYNNKYGVFGELFNQPSTDNGIPMALKQEVTEGPATIYTTLDGSGPKEYSINIDKIDYKNTDTKNMTIRITDSELIKKTGGIVQGMSGSPIIQNGKLAGAVTHVFISDPTRGYAIFSENMYESGIHN